MLFVHGWYRDWQVAEQPRTSSGYSMLTPQGEMKRKETAGRRPLRNVLMPHPHSYWTRPAGSWVAETGSPQCVSSC